MLCRLSKSRNLVSCARDASLLKHGQTRLVVTFECIWTRDEHGSGLDRTAFFFKLADQDWIGLGRFLLFWCDYSVATTRLVLRWNARFTTNGMCPKNNTIYRWHEQAIIEWSRCVNSIVACCHSAKLCAHAARAFRSQQNGAVTRMQGRVGFSLHTKNVRSMRFVVKRRGSCYNHSAGVALKCAVHHERDVGEEQYHIYVAWTSNNRVIAACELYCYLLPQCEALHSCNSGFPIATILTTSKMFVVMWFHRFVWQCIFCHQWQKVYWDYFAMHPPVRRLDIQCWVRITSSKLNVVKVLVSIPTVWVFSRSALTITPLMGVLVLYFFKKFWV